MITSYKVDQSSIDLSIEGDGWSKIPEMDIPLEGTPVNAIDSSKYIKDTVSRDEIGLVDRLTLQVVHDEARLRIRLSWKDPNRDENIETSKDFSDQAAVMFPLKPGASAMTMGSEQSPVNIWFWRASGDTSYDVISRGMGTSERRAPSSSDLHVQSKYRDNSWTVIFDRKRTLGKSNYAEFSNGTSMGIAFAIWAGSNRERGPLKAFSGEFMQFEFRSNLDCH